MFAVVNVCADGGTPGVVVNGEIDDECAENGFDYGIVKFEWDDAAGYVPEYPPISPYSVNVSGNDDQASWEANPAVGGVLHKEDGELYIHSGGTSGVVDMNSHQISHITFCGSYSTTTTTIPQAPEFGSMGAIGLLLLLVPAYAYLVARKD